MNKRLQPNGPDDREERLAEALRANLRKRKAQARDRRVTTDDKTERPATTDGDAEDQ